MDFNIIIRTIVLKSGKAYFHVGAGIVADSDPESEYQETLHKAGAMIEVLGGQLIPDE
jgi:anthranilate/para-aminobenzoate synthase component I